MASAITSQVGRIQFLDNIGLQFNFTGTPTGTFAVQVSIDHEEDNLGNVIVAGNWIPLTFSSSPIASGAAGTIYIDLNQLSAPWIRVVYTPTSGAGSLNAFLCGKAV